MCLGSLAISGAVSVFIGDVTDPAATLVLGAIWGTAVVADSAQYSTMVTEVVDKEVFSFPFVPFFAFLLSSVISHRAAARLFFFLFFIYCTSCGLCTAARCSAR